MSLEKGKQEITGWGGARPGAGRKPFVPTEEDRQQVEKLAGLGLSQDQISALIQDGIAKNVLLEYFPRELELGKAKAHAKIGGKLFQKAMDGDTASLIWWTKTQMRWAETQKHEIVQTTISINGALEAAKNRLINSDIIDVESRQLEQSQPQVLTSDVDVKKPTESGLGGSEG